MLDTTSPIEKLMRRFELTVVIAVQVLLVAGVAIATVMLYVLFVERLRSNVASIGSVGELQASVQHLFSGALVVLLGLELIETVKAYFIEHHVRTELILAVALIAVVRHVILIELEQVTGGQLAGLGALIASLAAGYYVIRRTHADSAPGGVHSKK